MPSLPTSCSADASFLETEVAEACREKTLETLHIHELPRERLIELGVPSGFHVVVKVRRKGPRYMTTRRERDQPRLFRHLERLTRFLDSLCPGTPVTLYREKSPKIDIRT